ncbi:MAG: histidinol-phosphate transaminase [Nitrospirae bacterium]|nr:histidinol-phosphate transaminase [Nitrospirota bacterium]
MKNDTSNAVFSLVLPNVRALRAYEAKEIPCRVKLDANESPYMPANADVVADAMRLVELNRYPDPDASALKKILAGMHGLSPDNLLLGNGSDEIISLLITTFGGPVLYPVPTFSMYGIIARGLGAGCVEVPLDARFDLDVARMKEAISASNPKLIFLASPNNPTGNRFLDERILEICEASSGIVVVDEAYQPFAGGDGFIPRLADFPRMIVLRTLSKIGLAALRLGFMAASPEIVGEVNKIRLPFNINSLSQAAAVCALSKFDGINSAIESIAAGRDRMVAEMAGVNGVTVFPSDANFILFRVGDAPGVYARLLERGILVRNLDSSVGGCLRVTVGRPEENSEFIEALKGAVI